MNYKNYENVIYCYETFLQFEIVTVWRKRW